MNAITLLAIGIVLYLFAWAARPKHDPIRAIDRHNRRAGGAA